jgi:hypothetical protein
LAAIWTAALLGIARSAGAQEIEALRARFVLPVDGTRGIAADAVRSAQATFATGEAVISPATGQPIAPAAVLAVSSLISSGTPASLANVAGALHFAGAPSAPVAALAQAAAILSGANASAQHGAVLAAATAFNALVASSSAAFLRNPPPAFLAMHAALLPMAVSAGH